MGAISFLGPHGEGKGRFPKCQVRAGTLEARVSHPTGRLGNKYLGLFLLLPSNILLVPFISPTQPQARVKGEAGTCGPQMSASCGAEQDREGLSVHQDWGMENGE